MLGNGDWGLGIRYWVLGTGYWDSCGLRVAGCPAKDGIFDRLRVVFTFIKYALDFPGKKANFVRHS